MLPSFYGEYNNLLVEPPSLLKNISQMMSNEGKGYRAPWCHKRRAISRHGKQYFNHHIRGISAFGFNLHSKTAGKLQSSKVFKQTERLNCLRQQRTGTFIKMLLTSSVRKDFCNFRQVQQSNNLFLWPANMSERSNTPPIEITSKTLNDNRTARDKCTANESGLSSANSTATARQERAWKGATEAMMPTLLLLLLLLDVSSKPSSAASPVPL